MNRPYGSLSLPEFRNLCLEAEYREVVLYAVGISPDGGTLFKLQLLKGCSYDSGSGNAAPVKWFRLGGATEHFVSAYDRCETQNGSCWLFANYWLAYRCSLRNRPEIAG